MNRNQKKAVELFGVAMQSENYPPLAGKVLGLFYVSKQKHFTFDEIVKTLGYSKSSVSTALKFIMDLGILKYTLKEDIKRRRYFYIDVKAVKEYYARLVDSFIKQNELFKEVIKLRGEEDDELTVFLEDVVILNEKFIKIVDAEFKTAFRKMK